MTNEKFLLQACRNEISREVEGAGKIRHDSFSSNFSGKESPLLISANRDEGIMCMKKPKQVLLY